MGGSSKKAQTIGYWYRPLIHFGWCQGPIDAFLEFRGGDRTAWKGEATASGQIYIDAMNLWGGEKSEGGIAGYFDLMFGEATQEPNAFLATHLGDRQPAYRDVATGVFRGGRYGAMNPYPKPASFLLRRILKGWDDDVCWYPETAPIPMLLGELLSLTPTSTGWKYLVGAGSEAYADPSFDDSSWETGASPFASGTGHPYVGAGGYPDVVGTTWPINTTIWVRRRFTIPNPFAFQLEIFVDNYATVWVNGTLVLPRVGSTAEPSDEAFRHAINVPASALVAGENVIVLKAEDEGERSYAAFKITSQTGGLIAMNPAHMIYDSLVSESMQGEPASTINEASFIAAADRFHSEGLGLCTKYNADQETVEAFRQRIANLAGAYCSRSRADGQWYLDVIRADFDLESLPILTDDDIIEFSEQDSIQDDAVNQVSVRWFDRVNKEDRTTAPLQALGAIMAADGVNAETLDYPEIPTEALALRIGARELHAKATPTRKFPLVCKRKPAYWRIGQRFRLQSVKRGIADMVCQVGDIDAGTLASGAVRLVAIQDHYSMPDTVYVEAQQPGDVGDQGPRGAPQQRLFEIPYYELVRSLSAADLQALPEDIGMVGTVATRPSVGVGYALYTHAEGEEFGAVNNGDWCPAATFEEAAGYMDTVFTVSAQSQLSQAAIGGAVLWENEICRLVARDELSGTITLARGCADTVPVKHAAGTVAYFYEDALCADAREYADGETVSAKLLTRTGAAIQSPAEAPTLTAVIGARKDRPYPPAMFRVNGVADPDVITGEITLTWVHRDRVLQADQLVDTETASTGPEAGTTYTARWYVNDVLEHTDSAISGTSVAYTPIAGGLVRVEVESVRDSLTSWQMQVREFFTAAPLLDQTDTPITDQNDQQIFME